MAILTNFLKLLKPEKNDYVDVDKHISENYDKIDSKMQELSTSNNGKLDKGAVSTEYDTAKKIEDKIKTTQSTVDNKLNKGNVPEKYNTAEKIGNEIDKSLYRILPKDIGNTETVTDLNNIYEAGFYNSQSNENKFINAPSGLAGNAFELTVTGLEPNKIGHTTQILKEAMSNKMWIRTQIYRSTITWTQWQEIIIDSSAWKITFNRIQDGTDLNNLQDLGFWGSYYASDNIINNPFTEINKTTGGIGVTVLTNAGPAEDRMRVQMIYDRKGNIAYRFKDSGNWGYQYIASPDLLWGMLSMPNFKSIQTAGTKIAGNIYWDRDVNPKKPYLCRTTNTSIVPDSNFVLLNLADICKKVYAMNNKFPFQKTIFTFNGDRTSWKDVTKTELKTANLIQVTVQDTDWADNKNQTYVLANNGGKVYLQPIDQESYTIYSIDFSNGLIKKEVESSNATSGALRNNVIREITILY